MDEGATALTDEHLTTQPGLMGPASEAGTATAPFFLYWREKSKQAGLDYLLQRV